MKRVEAFDGYVTQVNFIDGRVRLLSKYLCGDEIDIPLLSSSKRKKSDLDALSAKGEGARIRVVIEILEEGDE